MGGNPFKSKPKPAPAPKKVEEQPKVEAQMQAPKPEDTAAEIALENKRKGRRSTILTGSLGDAAALETFKKTLLGG
jgi:translation initiation factor 1 (eIF-1/SUI1)